MVLKNVFVQQKQFPLILALAVTVHKCQGLLLDCAIRPVKASALCRHGVRDTLTCETYAEPAFDCI